MEDRPSSSKKRKLSDAKELKLKTLDQCLEALSDTRSPAKTTEVPPSLEATIQSYAPPGMEESFRKLYQSLRPALLSATSNASAVLQGPRGSGKSLLLNRVLQALTTERPDTFRLVQLDGNALPATNVAELVREILRQLTETVQTDTADKIHPYLSLQRRQSSFVNNIQLFNEILQVAQADQVPILIILDPLDAFQSTVDTSVEDTTHAGPGRQVLLYHLWDRVASDGSLLSLVGLTSHYAWLGQLEKRIQSRAQGTTTWIVLEQASPEPVLRYKVGSDILEHCPSLDKIIQQVHDVNNTDNLGVAVRRNQQLGKSIQWFHRLWYRAIALYRWDVEQTDASVDFLEDHLWQALADLDGVNSSLVSTEKASVHNNPVRIYQGQATEGRMRALQDTTGPQAAILIAARRILGRDNQRADGAAAISLTADRLLEECQFAANRYSNGVLVRALEELQDSGLLRPAADHSGGGGLQYSFHTNASFQHPLGRQMPLQLAIDVHREFPAVLEQNLMNCSTALREWGKKLT